MGGGERKGNKFVYWKMISNSGLEPSLIGSHSDKLIKTLTAIVNEVSQGDYRNAGMLFELTKSDLYPPDIVALAESFGMMIVKVAGYTNRFRHDSFLTPGWIFAANGKKWGIPRTRFVEDMHRLWSKKMEISEYYGKEIVADTPEECI